MTWYGEHEGAQPLRNPKQITPAETDNGFSLRAESAYGEHEGAQPLRNPKQITPAETDNGFSLRAESAL